MKNEHESILQHGLIKSHKNQKRMSKASHWMLAERRHGLAQRLSSRGKHLRHTERCGYLFKALHT